MLCPSARAREELICAKRAFAGAVVHDEAIDFDELGAILPAPHHQLVWHNPGVLVASFRVRVSSSAILRRAGTRVNLHATQSLKCPVLACPALVLSGF